MKKILDIAYGDNASLNSIVRDEEKLKSARKLMEKLEPPKINSMLINRDEDRDSQIKGFRFMGQRFTIDAAIFQKLIDRDVPLRMLPKGLDIPAAMGSDEALGILESMGETKYDNYLTNMETLRKNVNNLRITEWTQNLYWGWMYTLHALLDPKTDGYPQFLMNEAWTRKDLNTYLGSWTELKHDTILYAKQVYAEMGGDEFGKKDDRGYVEPNPVVYSRLAALIKMTKDGLNSRELLINEDSKKGLDIMEELAASLQKISEKELSGEKITDEEYELIRSYGGQIEHLWKLILKEDGGGATPVLEDNPAAVVADVATGLGGALEEATGFINEIYVVVPVDGKLKIARGGVYSYYEFTQPTSDRLTDSKWRAMLEEGLNPELPAWTDSFMDN